jgi:hypothetical protein
MPANDMLINPRTGHIDREEGDLISAPVGLSVEYREAPTGEMITLLHLDVGSGMDVETPFSVGIPLRAHEAQLLAAAVTQAIVMGHDGHTFGPSDRLN